VQTKPISRQEALALVKEVFVSSLPTHRLPSDETPLFGPEAELTSMELVALVADLEDAIADRWSTQIILADEKALSLKKSPFRNLAALAEFVQERLSNE
jgi:hypothetical protein